MHSVQDAAAALHMPVAWSASNILLPIGISFFTFQGISYIVDIYRRDVPPARNVVDFGMYHTLFPQLIAGPIVRFGELQARVRHRPISVEDVHAGCSVSALRLVRKSSLPTAWAYWRIACSAEIRTERVSDGVARFMPLLHPPFEEGMMVKANWAWPAVTSLPGKAAYENVSNTTPGTPGLLKPVLFVGDSFLDGVLRSGLQAIFRKTHLIRWTGGLNVETITGPSPGHAMDNG